MVRLNHGNYIISLMKGVKGMENLFKEYLEWVKQEGHLTPCASSVLQSFITAKNYTYKEYDYLAKELKF